MVDVALLFERADDAVALSESKTFQYAVAKLRQQYLEELLAAPVGTLTATAAHAKLVALEDIPRELNILINDAKMHQQRRT